MTGGDVAVDVLQERLGQAAPLTLTVVQALEREPHLSRRHLWWPR